MDRISHLPEPIVHQILDSFDTSHGPPVDLVRMSVLSKTWFDFTASYPNLDFDISDFRCEESFYKYVEYTTSRFCHQKNVTTAEKLKLLTTVEKPAEKDVIDQCLELHLQKGVKKLLLEIIYSPEVPNPMLKYRLPDILLSVPVLESLTICHCDLPSSLMVDGVKFKSLIRLKLIKVRIDDEVIKHLTSGCPLLHDLTILMCHGFKSFCVLGHQNLKQVRVSYNTSVERIDIEAPNLNHLWVHVLNDRGPPPMNLASCKKLTTVKYHGYYLPNDFLSNFRFIEILHLTINDDTCKNLKWSSQSLRALVLDFDCNLEEIELNTPNLVFFICGLFSFKMKDELLSLLRDLTHLKACMRCYPYGCIDVIWFQKLRLFLEKKNGFKPLNLYIETDQEFHEFEEINAIELPPYELEHVELQLDTHKELLDPAAFVAAVLWFFSPRSLTLRSYFPLTDFEDVVKVRVICGHT